MLVDGEIIFCMWVVFLWKIIKEKKETNWDSVSEWAGLMLLEQTSV